MITGRVNERHEATIPVAPAVPATRGLRRYAAIVDTGLDHFLMVPGAVITQLGYPITETDTMVMGNEQRHEFDRSFVAILWDGEPKGVPVLVSESEEWLVGARLLAGSYLTLAMIPGGLVTISRLPAA
jgi:predicted aspartyl protease